MTAAITQITTTLKGNRQMTPEENLTRPPECCGLCPPTTTGYDCTCAGNPRCKGPNGDPK